MKKAIDETNRRRQLQKRYNEAHGITPESIKKEISDILGSVYEADYVTIPTVSEPEEEYISLDRLPKVLKALKKDMFTAAKRLDFEEAALKALKKDMFTAAKGLDFEEAARLRDRISNLEKRELFYRNSSNF
jgi:excinuclease ABC subunit B